MHIYEEHVIISQNKKECYCPICYLMFTSSKSKWNSKTPIQKKQILSQAMSKLKGHILDCIEFSKNSFSCRKFEHDTRLVFENEAQWREHINTSHNHSLITNGLQGWE